MLWMLQIPDRPGALDHLDLSSGELVEIDQPVIDAGISLRAASSDA